ncbi:MAG: CDP-alcohol phosphatidyltransferase family protein [Thermoplasmata archaeon]
MLEKYKEPGQKYVAYYANYFKNWNPNSLTLMAFMFCVMVFISLLLARYYSFYFLFFTSFFSLMAGFFDLMDGAVARLRKIVSKKGDLLDHVLDRYGDMIILTGFAMSGFVNFYLVIISMIGILLTSYMGTQAQAVGFNRLYSGLVGRADRLLIFIIFPFFQMIMLIPLFPYHYFMLYSYKITLLDIAFLYLAIASHYTALERFYILWKQL